MNKKHKLISCLLLSIFIISQTTLLINMDNIELKETLKIEDKIGYSPILTRKWGDDKIGIKSNKDHQAELSEDTTLNDPNLNGIRFNTQPSDNLPWYSTDWKYRKKITISSSSAGIPTEYSVSLIINHAILVSDGKSRVDGDDIRVMYWSGSGWIELDRILDPGSSWNNISTKIWFKTQSIIPVYSFDNDYYLYYGNPSASSPPSNSNNVFFFYDGFESGDFNAWNSTNIGSPSDSITVSTDQVYNGIYSAKGQVDNVADAQASSWKDFADEVTLFASTYIYLDPSFSTTGHVTVMQFIDTSSGWQNLISTSINDDMTLYMWNDYFGEAYGYQATNTISTGTWHRLDMQITTSDTDGEARLWLNGNLEIEATGVNISNNAADRFSTVFYWASPKTEPNTLYIDDCLLRLWVNPEPTTSLDIENYPWSNPSYKFRKIITINKTKVSDDLTNFPMLIDLYDGDLQDEAQASGGDIYFTDDSGIKLNHEIEVFNRVYNSTHAHLIAWVKMNLSSSQNTILSMYYGNPSIRYQQNPLGVWDDNYAGVWHLNEASGDALDSTYYGTSGTISGEPTQGITGQVDGAFEFDGIDDHVHMGDPADGHLDFGTGSFTVEVWVRKDSTMSTDQYGGIFKGNGNVANQAGWLIRFKENNNRVRFSGGDGSASVFNIDKSGALIDDTWIRLVGVLDRGAGTAYLYRNGQVIATDTSITSGNIDSSKSLKLSEDWSSSYQFKGLFDEIRLSNIARSSDWILTEYNNQYDPSSFYSISYEELLPDVWSIPLFRYRKTITINASKISGSGNLQNFPVLINLTDTDLQNTDKVQADGDDILFTDTYGTKLNHEIEYFNQLSGHLVAWVRVPSLSGTIDTNLTMYYGNNAIGSQENPTGVWNNSYDAVWHLSQDVSDSTSNNNDGTNSGSADVIGRIANGQNFDGVDDYIDVGSGTSIDNLFSGGATISFWIKPSGWGENDYGRVLDKSTSTGGSNGWSIYVDNDEGEHTRTLIFQRGFSSNRGSWTGSNDTISLDNWQYVVLTYDEDSTSNDPIIYINGSSISLDELYAPSGAASDDSAQSLRIGNFAGGTTRTFDGIIDNIQIHTNILSADWVLTEYENQNSPGNFYSIGTEESSPDVWSMPLFRYRKNITINASEVSGSSNLVNFPVLINISDTNLHDISKVQVDGDDILFTDAFGNRLDHEIELFDQAGNGTHANLVAWVKIPSLSDSSDTNITMYYGNNAIGSQERPTRVWSENYAGVWHLDDLTSSTIEDSTTNNNNGTKDTVNPPLEIDGKIGKAQRFSNLNEYINVGTSGFNDNSGTVEIWGLAYGFSDYPEGTYLFGHTTEPSWNNRIQIYVDDTANGYLDIGLGDQHDLSENITILNLDTWYHIVLSWNGTNYAVYVNGVLKANGTYTGLTAIHSFVDIGNNGDSSDREEAWNGILDEIRVSSVDRTVDWIATEYNNQYNPDNFISVSTEEIYQNWWADVSFSKRKDIVINNNKVSGDLTNYPVLIDITSNVLKSGTVQPDGDDILFTDANGVKLDHEIEYFNQSSSDGHLIAWVRVPTLSSSTDTVISMYYSNAVIETQENPEGVWTNDYVGVWHLAESGNGTVGEFKDSTSNNNDGTGGGSAGISPPAYPPGQTTGQIGYGQEFDELTQEHIEIPTSSSLESPSYSITIVGWVNAYHGSLDGSVVFSNWGYGLDFLNNEILVHLNGTVNNVTSDVMWLTAEYASLGWHHYAITYDGTYETLFIDGVQIASVDCTGEIQIGDPNPNTLRIGSNPTWGTPGATGYVDGKIDEVRISTETKSANWINTVFENQNNPSSFYTVGSENVYEDDTPPVVNNFGVDDPGTGTGIFWAEIIDIGSEVTTANITINGTEHSMSNNGTHWIYQQSVNLTDYYTYQITNASDTYSNNLTTATSEKSYTFIQDSIAPTVVDWEYYPEQGFVGSFNANVSDSWGVIDTVIINISLIQSPFTSIDWQVMRYTPSGYINDTMDSSIEDDTIYFVVTVNDTSGNSYTSPAHQDYVPNRNNAPVASNLSFVPDPPTSNESLLVTYDYNDTDSDPESGTEIRWYKNGILQAIHDDLTTIAASYLFEGDQWNVTVRPKDGQDFGIVQNSSTVTVQNGAPEVTTASVSPSSPGTTSDLTATYTYIDSDGDGENTGNREVEWFKNGQPTAFTGLALSSSNTAKGEDWSFRIRVHDGMSYSDWYQAGNVTIANTAPTASNLNVENSANLRTVDNLIANWTFNDVDGDNPAAYYIIWYANGILQPLLNNTMVVNGGNTTKGQSWYFKLIVNDGTVNSSADWDTAFSSPSALILNTMPIADNVTITQNPRANDSLTAGWDFDDDDGDSEISAEIRWYKNGVLQASLNDQSTVSSTETSKGETWNFTLRVFDGEDYSIQYNSTPTIILNTAPSAISISLSSTTNRSDEDLAASWTFDDIDTGDVQLAFNLTWYIDGSYAGIFNGTIAEQGNDYTAILEYSGNLTKNDEWNFIVQVHDGVDWSSSYNSTVVTILNAKPTIIGVATFNVTQNVNTTNDLEIKYTYFDNDGDSEGTPIIYWYVNGTYFASKDGHDKLYSSDTGKGDTWSYVIRLHDGYEYSENITSQPVDIEFINNLPSALFLNIAFASSNNNTLDDLIADYTFSDPDSGQYEYGSIIVWYLNRSGTEEVKYNYTLNMDERIANLTILASETQKGDQWWFSVLVKDGTNFTAAWKNSTLVTILNSLPAASSHAITSTPKEGYTTDNLTASWTFNDNDTIDESTYDYGSDFNITWYKDGVHQAGLNNKTLIENGNTTKGEFWNYTLRVWDGEAWSIQYNSSTIEILNTVPTASTVNIENGGNLRTNDVLKANWTFVDVDSIDAEQAFNITWYKFVSTSYVVQSNLHNKTIVDAGNTSRFDSWKFSLSLHDSDDWTIIYYSTPIQILNTAPEIDGAVTMTASSFTRGNDLTVVYDYIDADDNSSESGTEIRWYKNNVLQPALNDELVVPGSYVFKDDTWNVSVRVSDGFDFSSMVNSTVYTINNTAPMVTSAEILYTGSLTTESTLGVSYNTSDADGDSIVEYQIIWLVDSGGGFAVYSSLENQTVVANNYTSKHQDWRFRVKVHDGDDWSNYVNVTSDVTIVNTEPFVTNITLSGGETTDSNITISYDFVDADNDTESGTIIKWKVIWGGPPDTYEQAVLTGDKIFAGAIVYCQIIPDDGDGVLTGLQIDTDEYSPNIINGFIIVGNTAPVLIGDPVIVNATGGSTYQAGNPLHVNYTAFDRDGNETSPNNPYDILLILDNGFTLVFGADYRWYKNGLLQLSITGATVDPSLLFKGDSWMVNVSISDRYGTYSTWYQSSSIAISNSPPEILGITWNTETPTAEDDLEVSNYHYYDSDGDPDS
ncbi:MAG: DUF2341 domain-containing protein, partial [Candidatus Hodarchaeales archaeon]